MRHQQDLSQKEQEATGKIFERMQRIIAKISITENFSMVFDRGQAGLVFAKPHLDLTNELIRRYNAGEGKEGGGAAASKPAAAKPTTPAKK
jgi:outer membrane protein